MPAPLQDLIDRMGSDAALEQWVPDLNLMLRKSPASVLDAIVTQRPVFMRHAKESLKKALWRLELDALYVLGDAQSGADNFPADKRSFCKALRLGGPEKWG